LIVEAAPEAIIPTAWMRTGQTGAAPGSGSRPPRRASDLSEGRDAEKARVSRFLKVESIFGGWDWVRCSGYVQCAMVGQPGQI
jgi:hypothetical protein